MKLLSIFLILSSFASDQSIFPLRELIGPEQFQDGERQTALRGERLVVEKIETDLAKIADGVARRDAHPKDLGLWRAEFTVNDSVPFSNPLLVPGKKYESLVRFSSAITLKNDPNGDAKGDLRGMAVKIFNVNVGDQKTQTVDLVTINDNKFPTRTAKAFVDLMDATGKDGGTLKMAGWFFNSSVCPWNWRFKELGIAGMGIYNGGKDASLLQPFHSQINYAANEDQIVKFAFLPHMPAKAPVRPENPGKDFLTEDLQNRLNPETGSDVKFDLVFQVRPKNLVTTQEVEDATTVLSTDEVPFQKAGTLTLLTQNQSDEMRKLAEVISYNPGRSVFEPLGSVGRLRPYVYNKGSIARRKMNGIVVDKEPESLEEYLNLVR